MADETFTPEPESAKPDLPPVPASQASPSPRQPTPSERIAGWRFLGISSFLFAFLQALCPAVIAISAIRVAIGLGALAVAASTDAPARGWHAEGIRVPMMLAAAFGAALNLFVLWHVRRLRARPAAQWRIAPLSAGKRRSERLQIVLAVLTFLCLAAEWITHPMIHRLHP